MVRVCVRSCDVLVKEKKSGKNENEEGQTTVQNGARLVAEKNSKSDAQKRDKEICSGPRPLNRRHRKLKIRAN